MKTTVKILIVLFALSFVNLSFAQEIQHKKEENPIQPWLVEFTKKEVRENYKKANHLLTNDQVDKALILFAKLAINDPTNSNFIYHVGLCYYHKGNHSAAKEFLIIASERTSKKYRNKPTERHAPPEVFNLLDEMKEMLENPADICRVSIRFAQNTIFKSP